MPLEQAAQLQRVWCWSRFSAPLVQLPTHVDGASATSTQKMLGSMYIPARAWFLADHGSVLVNSRFFSSNTRRRTGNRGLSQHIRTSLTLDRDIPAAGKVDRAVTIASAFLSRVFVFLSRRHSSNRFHISTTLPFRNRFQRSGFITHV